MKKSITYYLVIVMFIMGITPRVNAEFSLSFDRSSDLQKIQKVLESKMISERLKQLGFSEEEIQVRLSQLDDYQIHQIALRLDEIDVAGYVDFNDPIILTFVLIILSVPLLIIGGLALLVDYIVTPSYKPPIGYWTKNDFEPKQFKKDFEKCEEEAIKNADLIILTRLFGDKARWNNVFGNTLTACMEDKSYSWNISEVGKPWGREKY